MALEEKDKQDIKEIVSEVFDVKFDVAFDRKLEPFAKAIQEDFQKTNTEIAAVRGDLRVLSNEVREMKENSSELFTKLDKFITLYENTLSEQASLAKQIARLEDRVVKLEARLQ